MKRFVLTVLFACVWIMTKGQSLELGLRDNQYVHVSFMGKAQWLVGYEQSLLNVKAKEQSGRVFAGYIYEKDAWAVTGIAYGGTEYAWDWQTAGVLVKGDFVKRRVGIGVSLNANYDTYFDFQMNYDVEARYVIWQKNQKELGKQDLAICASFGNLPEYRENIKNLRVGLKFTGGNLWVQPEVCLPNIEKRNSCHIRLLCNFGWNLPFK